MNKRIFFLSLLLLVMLSAFFAFSASAEEEAITVTYNYHDGGVRATAEANDDGSYTLRNAKFSADAMTEMADGSFVEREFYGWYDQEGNLYYPGEVVRFSKSTKLYEAYGVTVYSADDLKKVFPSCYVKLGTNITVDKTLGDWWTANTLNLNDFTLTSTAQTVISVQRGSIIIHGPGKIVHEPAEIKTDVNACALYTYAHGYGDASYPQQVWIGKGVELTTPYSAYRCGSVTLEKLPNIVIAGTVNAKSLARISPAVVGASCYITESAEINLTNSFIDFVSTSGIATCMKLTLNGSISVADGTGAILTDFMLTRVDVNVEGGSYRILESDMENLMYYLPENMYFRGSDFLGEVWYDAVVSNCTHSWVKDEESSIPATKTENGRDVLVCNECHIVKNVVSVYSPDEEKLNITVRDENGTESVISVSAKDVFDYRTEGTGVLTEMVLIGIKGDGKYNGASIVGFEVPYGFTAVRIINENTSVEKIYFADGANTVVRDLSGLKALKTIEIGKAEVEFCPIGEVATLEAVISKVAGATVKFMNNCFDGKTSLVTLEMCNGSTYYFYDYSFKLTGIETVIFPDEATINFAGVSAFYEASTRYVYFGKSITEIKNKPFDRANNLELVIIMAAKSTSEYTFCVEKPEYATSKLVVYWHADSVSINGNTFYNRSTHGVELYVLDKKVTSLSKCVYTVYSGIPHKYTEGVTLEPTCISTGTWGMITDCACGIATNATYTVYTADGSFEYTLEKRELPISNKHVLGENLVDVIYENGYLEKGKWVSVCALCKKENATEDVPTAAPLFVCMGYSVSEFGITRSITQGYEVNTAAVTVLKKANPYFAYGVVSMVNTSGKDAKPLRVNGPSVRENEMGVVFKKITLAGNTYVDVKLTGISEGLFDTNIILCAYIFDGNKIQYLDNGSLKESLLGASYNTLLNK